MTSIHQKYLLALANLLLPVAILVFAKGFFPYKPFLPGIATSDGLPSEPSPFDKIILMVVDALRRSVPRHHCTTQTESC